MWKTSRDKRWRKCARQSADIMQEILLKMVLGALAALLESEGDISVIAQAQDGKAALDLVLAHHPDVVVTDIEMPEMTGLELANELKRRSTGTAVIILTTFARSGYLRRALEAGARGYEGPFGRQRYFPCYPLSPSTSFCFSQCPGRSPSLPFSWPW